ncbi:50S ribosomal protein L4 [bacterium]|nr:50S ribosomal protein L4 [Parcubacteria group bacterium]MBF05131.1 50S ribosomal protein L4 [bacterium]|tara:strand:+ start:20255 stop:20941 length:687 start_codon:yes stop_codon:yes gene_type:complete
MKSDIYTQEGKKKGSVELPTSVFEAAWKSSLVHQVVVGMQANARTPIAHTKIRSEVKGGGKKPWKQKGTGRARHGSSRSPIWRGGGVTFGPRNDKVFAKKINRKERAQALYSVLSRKVKEGQVLFVDSLTFEAPKASHAHTVIANLAGVSGFETLASKKHNTALIVLAEKNTNTQKSFSNFGNIKVGLTENLNTVDALKYKHLIIVSPEESIKELEARAQVSRVKATT